MLNKCFKVQMYRESHKNQKNNLSLITSSSYFFHDFFLLQRVPCRYNQFEAYQKLFTYGFHCHFYFFCLLSIKFDTHIKRHRCASGLAVSFLSGRSTLRYFILFSFVCVWQKSFGTLFFPCPFGRPAFSVHVQSKE